jgi:hypothetical protein
MGNFSNVITVPPNSFAFGAMDVHITMIHKITHVLMIWNECLIYGVHFISTTNYPERNRFYECKMVEGI